MRPANWASAAPWLSRHFVHGCLCLVALAGSARAQTPWVWTGLTDSEWGTGSNWDLGTVPNASDAVANINSALTVNVSDTGTGGAYPYVFGTLAANIASGSVVIGTTAATTDILAAQTSTGIPVINVTTGNTTIFMYASLEGTQGFEKTGAGKLTWRFNGADQTYAGTILVSGGILGIDRNGSLGNDDNDITIASGARLLAEPGSNSGTVTLPATRTITLAGTQSQIGSGNAAVNLVIEGPVGETVAGNGLVKTDAGTVTLQGTLSYTGETRIAGGTLALAGPALLPSDQNLRFNQATGTLNVGSTSQTVRTLVMDNTAGNKTITGTGGSLLVNGDAVLQLSGGNGVTYSFSGLDAFTFDRATRAFNVQTANTASVTTSMVVSLAAGGTAGGTNAITASTIQIGGGNSTGNNGNTARLRLGTSNTFQTSTFQVGGFNAGGVVDFQAGLTNPTLTLRGADGTSAATTWTIGETSSGARRGEGVVNLTGGSLDAVVTDLRIGRHVATVDTINDTSSLTMPAGTLTAATLTMAAKSNGGTPTLTSTLNQSGGTVSIGTITLGDGAGTGAATLLPTYNLTGGRLMATTIGAGAGTSYDTAATVRTLNLDGGTLGNLPGGGLAIDGLDPTSSGRINLTLGAAGGTFEAEAGQAITIGANTAVTGAGGLTKTGVGSLVLGAPSSASGPTTVSAGTLEVANDGAVASSAVTVADGATLAVASGVTMKAPSVTVNGGTVSGGVDVNAATGIATLTINSGTIATGSALVVGAGGLVDLPDAARVTVGVASLAVDHAGGGGRLDLGAGEVGIAAGGISAADLRADIIAGSNGGAWNGVSGITSATAAASGGTRAVGYTVAGDGSARVSFAAPGDTNLDGTVDLLDLLAILSSGTYEQPVPAVWDQGDFNYDGVTDLLDLLAILGSGTYDQGNYFPAAPAALGGLGSVAAVPEPGVAGVAVAAGGWLLARRYRRAGRRGVAGHRPSEGEVD